MRENVSLPPTNVKQNITRLKEKYILLLNLKNKHVLIKFHHTFVFNKKLHFSVETMEIANMKIFVAL